MFLCNSSYYYLMSEQNKREFHLLTILRKVGSSSGPGCGGVSGRNIESSLRPNIYDPQIMRT